MKIAFYFKGQNQRSSLPIVRARVREGINHIPWVELILASTNPKIVLDDYLGQKAALEAYTSAAGSQVTVARWKGRIFEFGRVDTAWTSEKLFAYRAVIRSSLWTLAYSQRSRALRNVSRPEALKKVFKEAGITGFKLLEPLEMKKAHPVLEQIVQYQQTDLDFVLRLMRLEGMSFFFLPVGLTFQFSSLSDPSDYFRVTDGHPRLSEQKSPLIVKYQPHTGMVTSSLHIDSVTWQSRVVPQEMSVQSYFSASNYQAYAPTGGKRKVEGGTLGDLYRVEGTTARSKQNSGWTPQDYADKITQVRAEELSWWHSQGAGTSNDINLRPCLLITMSPDPFEQGSGNQKPQYQIVEVEHQWHLPPGSQGDAQYQNAFTMTAKDAPLRPAEVTPWPKGAA